MGIAYWNYIQTHCYGYEWSTLETAFSISYGDSASQTAFWTMYSCIIFCVGIFVNKFDVLIRNKERAIVWHQIYSSEDDFCRLLYFGVPYYIFFSGTYFIVGFMGISIKTLFLFFVGIVILWFFLTKVMQYSAMQKYYLNIAEDPAKLEHLIIVQESQYVQKSFIMQHLYKAKLLEKMESRGIRFFPNEMGMIPDNYIKLDVYDEWMFIRPENQRKHIFSSMSSLRGTFNLMFAPDNLPESVPEYDGAFTGIENLINEILKLDGYLNYKRDVVCELKNIEIEKLRSSTCISEEISGFRRYMENLTDDFLSFDYAIKWLEITNYMFALIGISKRNLLISEEIQELIGYADFNKWRHFIDDRFGEDNDLRSSIMTSESDKTIFEVFQKLWKIVTSRQYKFNNYTAQEMLDAANKLRDYTRGHGVFTFDVSQEMNLGLIKILVFLINHLIDYLSSVDSLDNLEKLGWVIYSGDVPYYLYSVDKKFEEFKYESFQMGSSISLPLDIQG